jgi:hypothetical protein
LKQFGLCASCFSSSVSSWLGIGLGLQPGVPSSWTPIVP